MIFSGLWLLVFVIIHVKAFRYGAEYQWPAGGRDLYRLEMENFSNPLMVALLRPQHARRRLAPVARHLERVPVARRSTIRRGRRASCRPARSSRSLIAGGVHRHRRSGRTSRRAGDGDEARRARFPSGPLADKWDRHKFEMKLVNPANKRKYTDHRRRHRPGRRVGGGVARRARLQRPELLHPGQPAPRAQHRRAGRHQRRQELPERRRQRLPAVLRHGQGRRLPLARSQRLPAGAAQRQHHRPVRGAGRAVRARVRRAARQPLVRRRAGVAHVLRARPDRPAAAARRLPVADAAGRTRGTVALFAAPRDARPGRRRRPGARHHRPQPGHRRDRALRRPTR